MHQHGVIIYSTYYLSIYIPHLHFPSPPYTALCIPTVTTSPNILQNYLSKYFSLSTSRSVSQNSISQNSIDFKVISHKKSPAYCTG